MATDAEIREAQRQAARDTQQKIYNAKQSPSAPSGARPMRRAPEPSSAEAIGGPPVDYGQGAMRGSADDILRSLEKENNSQGRRGKLDYLGHFANDDVTTEGHNVGMKPKGLPGMNTDIAHRGFRKLPGEVCSTMGKADHPSRYTDRPPVTVESPQMPLKPLRVKNPGKQ